MQTAPRFIATSLLTFFLTVTSFSAYALSGIPNSFNVAGKPLVLNGAGTRTKFIISVYHAGLYLQKKSSNAGQIMAANEPMAIRMKIVSGFASADKMKEALKEGFINSTGGKTAPIQPQIDQLMASFDKGVKTGDVYQLINMPGSGVHVVRNEVRVATIRSLPFKQALFGIWLSDRPVQASLKRSMLGK